MSSRGETSPAQNDNGPHLFEEIDTINIIDVMKKSIPFILFVFGFLTLNMFQGLVAIACMVIGLVMLIERIWPEKWASDAEEE